MTSAPLRLGLAGCGAFGTYVLDSAAGLAGQRLTAVTDPDPARADALAARHMAAVSSGFDALLARDDVDAVLLATPPATHGPLALAALRAGKHVFCEKPLATTVAEARELRAEAERRGLVLVVDHVLRYNPLLRALETLMRDGLLDRPRRFLFENDAADQDLGPDHWFWDEKHSGGIFVEHGVHFFDAARALLGSDPLSVRATAVHRPGSPHLTDMVSADVLHPGGVLASHLHSFTHAHRCERQLMRLDHGFAETRVTGWIPTHATVTAWTDDTGAAAWQQLPHRTLELLAVDGFTPHGGERVTVRVRRDLGDAGPARGRGQERSAPHLVTALLDLGGEERKPYVYAQSVRAALADLVRCVRDGGRPVADAESGLAAVAVAEAATRSAATGREAPVDVAAPAEQAHGASVTPQEAA